ncbi:hypothetical protein ACPPVO_13570 [Dactylosporangium sp. McL0621]|uniref:hypothetical protein n=1 Tax=Dactylosporangium sp. McL0621 TaxID=3415678 RepID=UPI003CF388F0
MFVVRADAGPRRRRYRRMVTLMAVGYALLAALFGVQMGLIAHQLDDLLAALVPGAVAGLLGFMFGSLLLVGGALKRLRAAAGLGRIMTVQADGLWIDAVDVFLPWEIVGQVRRRPWLRHEILMVTVRPGTAPDHPGAYGLGDDPKLWRAFNDTGVAIGLRDIVPDKERVYAEIARYHAVERSA